MQYHSRERRALHLARMLGVLGDSERHGSSMYGLNDRDPRLVGTKACVASDDAVGASAVLVGSAKHFGTPKRGAGENLDASISAFLGRLVRKHGGRRGRLPGQRVTVGLFGDGKEFFDALPEEDELDVVVRQ